MTNTENSPLKIKLPMRAIDVLIRQGGYEELIKKHFLLKRFFPNWSLRPDSVHAKKKFVRELFQRKSDREIQLANLILESVPENVRSILDIGCGLGLVDLVLQKRISPSPDIYLLDKNNEYTPLSSVGGGFHPQFIFTANLELTRDIFKQNGANMKKVHFVNPDNDSVMALSKVDVILSITSWGFHYPIETYWEGVKKIRHDESVLFIDLRKKTKGFDFLRGEFSYNCIIDETEKCIRAAFSNSELKNPIPNGLGVE